MILIVNRRRALIFVPTVLGLAFALGSLAACGQRGPLTLPSKPQAAASSPAKADGAAASPAPATR